MIQEVILKSSPRCGVIGGVLVCVGNQITVMIYKTVEYPILFRLSEGAAKLISRD